MSDDHAEKIVSLLEMIVERLSCDKPNKTLTVKQAAEYLNINYYTLLKLAHSGEIQFTPIGKKILFQSETLELWLKNKEMSSTKSFYDNTGETPMDSFRGLRKLKA